MFDRRLSRKLTVGNSLRLQETESTDMLKVSRILLLIYIAIGVFIAWDRHYITLPWLRSLASALLAIFLWFLILLGVNLHVHG
jgi:glucan phosphoethanolaminetransferase (alkaline phosphatase superfamily)